ncbi:endopeptidase, partial [Perkinsus sp. BL_2016]
MSRRYDSKTTTFSPEGRLFQVEYAMEAINNAGSLVGVTYQNGVVIAGEKKTLSKLLEPQVTKEKIFRLDDHVICGVAGVTADAGVLVELLRVRAQNFRLSFGEAIPVEQLALALADVKQGYTQFGGLRPFGVAFLFAGYDEISDSPCLYATDPSGNYASWKAHAVGANSAAAISVLKEDWSAELDLLRALDLVAKVLVKSMDTARPAAENLEIGVFEGRNFRFLADSEINQLAAKAK